MTERKIVGRLRRRGPSPAEAKRLNEIRRKVMREFPPKNKRSSVAGLSAQIKVARESKNLTWYAVAKAAGIPNPSTVRDIEKGRDVKLSNIEAVAKVLGLKLELVAAPEPAA